MSGLGLKYVHQGISVSSMEEAVQWYKNVFEAEVTVDIIHEFTNCHIVFMKTGDALFELFEYLGPEKAPTPEYRLESRRDLRTGGNKHVAYQMNDMPKFFREKVIPFNVKVDHGPEREGDNWMAFIMDNSGILYELYDVGGYKRDPHAFDDYDCKLE